MMQERTYTRSIRLELPNRPGALAEATAILAAWEVDIVRLEVWPEGHVVYDDLTLAAAGPEFISRAVRKLRGSGFEAATLPDDWWLRDWAREVFDAVEGLESAGSPEAELDVVLDVACRLANTSHSGLVAEFPGSEPVGRRIGDLARDFDSSWIRWAGPPDLVSTVERVILEHRTGPPEKLKPVDPVNGLATEVAGATATPTILVVVGTRAPFLAAEQSRVERFGRLVGRLQSLEPGLTAAI